MVRVDEPPNLASVRARYAAFDKIWPYDDIWHSHTHQQISAALARLFGDREGRILDVGSGDTNLGPPRAEIVRLDIVEKFLLRDGLGVVGDAERLPFASEVFEVGICVGSVINYCDPVAVVSQLSRVLKPGGALLLEFESSTSAEYLGRHEFGRAAALVMSSYQGQPEKLWLYSPSFVRRLLAANGLRVVDDMGFHVATALAFRLCGNDRRSMWAAPLDRVALLARALRSLACNRLVLAEKQGKRA